MTELFRLLGTIAVDNDEAIQALNDTSSTGEQTQSKLSKAFSGIGKGAAVVGKAVGTAMIAGGAAMGGLTVKALNLSGELEQNMGGSEAVFKQYAGKMQETAKNAFSNMGLSTSDFLGTANKMGSLFQGAGFSIEESSDLASSAMQRAADVASIMGIDTSTAMESIAGAAKGNFDMMDNLGVAMNDTTLQAYALEKGITKTTQEMTNQEKISLAMEMFMEKTAYATGNYAKENETLAGSLGTAKSALTNFLDGSGDVESLVSAFENVATVVVNSLTEIAPRLVTGLTEVINKIIPMLPPLLNQLLPVIIEGAVSLINGLVAALPMVIDALMSALPLLIEGVTQIINAVITALPQIMQSLVSALPTVIPMLIDGLVSMIVTLCTSFTEIIQPIIDNLPVIITSIVDALIENLPALIDGAVQLIVGLVNATPQIIVSLLEIAPYIIGQLVIAIVDSAPLLIDGFKQIWDSVKNAISAVIDGIIGLVEKLWNWCVEFVAPVLENYKNIISNAWNAIKSGISTAINAIKTVITNVWNAITTATSTVWNSIKTTISTIWNGIKSGVSNAINAVKTTISNVWNGIKNTTSNIWNGIKNTISNVINGAKNTVSNVVNGIRNTVSNVFNSVKSTVTSIWNGIKTAITTPIETAKNTIKNIVDTIKGFFSGMKLEFPKIKMPHFGISPSGWKIGDLLEGSIPKLSIDWYAKAMNNPMVMDTPTVFGYNPSTGSLKVGGEAGSEVVSGTNTLMNLISQAVSAQMSGMTYYLQQLISILADYFPQILEAMGQDIVADDGTIIAHYAPLFDKELGKMKDRKDRGR